MSPAHVTPCYHAPALLAPGTLQRPQEIPPALWDRMPWPARWRATRRLVRPPAWLIAAHANQAELRQLVGGGRHIVHAPGRTE